MNHTEPSRINRSDIRTSQRDRSRIDPIKLAGVTLLSLDAPGGGNIVSADAAAVRIDWPAALRQAGFTPDEGVVFELTHLSHCPNPAGILKWRPARFARASVAVKSKFHDRLPALRAAIEQQMLWAVPSLDPLYADVIAAERLKPTIQIVGGRYRTMKTQTLTLEAQLQAASAKLMQLRGILAERTEEQDRTHSALMVAQTAAQKEAVDALIEVRQPGTKYSAAIPGLRTRLQVAQDGAEAARGAVARQHAEVERLQGEIAAGAKQALLSNLQPLLKQFNAAIDSAALAADGISNLLQVSGQWIFAGDIFTQERDESATTLKNAVLTQLMQYARYEKMFTDSKMAA